jgi:hypothetical protein
VSVSQNLLKNKDGYNIVEYSLINSDNELFKFLYFNCRTEITTYLSYTDKLFIIIMNKKNFVLIDFFIKNNDISCGIDNKSISNLFFIAITENQREIADYVVEKFSDLLDTKNIEATMIYCIGNDYHENFKNIFSYPKLIETFQIRNIEKIVVYALISQNKSALMTMINDNYFLEVIKTNKNVLQKITNFVNEPEILKLN